MTAILDKLTLYFQYPFVRYALIVGVLIALCSSLLGVTLVLKRFSFIGDGLSHVAFGAMAIAAVLNLTNDMPLILCITVDVYKRQPSGRKNSQCIYTGPACHSVRPRKLAQKTEARVLLMHPPFPCRL